MIVLDLARHTYRTIGTYSAFDDVELDLEILLEGEVLNLQEFSLELVGMKKNGQVVRQSEMIQKIEPNILKIVLNKDFLDTPGIVNTQLYLTRPEQITSVIFNIMVGRSLSAEVVEESGVVNLLQDVDDYISNVTDKLGNLELKIEDNLLRVVNVDYAEQSRRDEEELRKSNELLRIKQESSRVFAEIGRNQAETRRDKTVEEVYTSEVQRQASELERLSNEEQRQLQEAIRNTDEAKRLINEQERVDNENLRILNEIERAHILESLQQEVSNVKAQEVEVANAEFLRQSEEQRRKQAEKQREVKFNIMLERADQVLPVGYSEAYSSRASNSYIQPSTSRVMNSYNKTIDGYPDTLNLLEVRTLKEGVYSFSVSLDIVGDCIDKGYFHYRAYLSCLSGVWQPSVITKVDGCSIDLVLQCEDNIVNLTSDTLWLGFNVEVTCTQRTSTGSLEIRWL